MPFHSLLPPELKQKLEQSPEAVVRIRVRWAILPEAIDSVEQHVVLELTGGLVTDVQIDRPDLDVSIDFPTTLLLPRFANLHTHLEFSQLREPLGPVNPFADWIRSVIGYRNCIEDRDAAIRQGIEESISAGVGTVGEIWTQDAFQVYQQAMQEQTPFQELSLILFREVIGIHPDQWQQRFEDLVNAVETLRRSDDFSGRVGLSPHAPYTVHPQLFQAVCQFATQKQLPLAFHLAETKEELELLKSQSGPIRDLLNQFGLWSEDIFAEPVAPLDYIRQLDDVPEACLIHCNYLTDGEVAAIVERPHLTIVYCPRTHAYFEHPPHRWQEIIARGGKVVLGTDGRSSNPDLSILAEAKFLVRKHAESSPLEILQMILPNSKPQQQRRLGQFQFYDLQTDAVSCPIQTLLQ